MSRVGIGQPRPRSGALVEAEILQVTTRLFAEKGFAATGIREIASECGITVAALYHYMNKKEDLLQYILSSVLYELIDRAELVVESTTTPTARIFNLARLQVLLSGTNLRTAQILRSELRALDDTRRAEIIEMRDRYQAIWAQTIAAGIKSGEFQPVDSEFVTVAALEMINGVPSWYNPQRRRSLVSVAETLGRHVLMVLGVVTTESDLENLLQPIPVERFGALGFANEPAIERA